MKEKIFFLFLFIFLNLSVIFFRDEVGIYSWIFKQDFKEKYTSVDKIIFDENSSSLATLVIRYFYGENFKNNKIYIHDDLNVKKWSFFTQFEYYCGIINCKLISFDNSNLNIIYKIENLNNQPARKVIKFNNFIENKFVEKINLVNCKKRIKKKNYIIFIKKNNLFVTCIPND